MPDDGESQFSFPATVEQLEEIPPIYRAVYTQQSDKTFQLIPGLANRVEPDGLKKALEGERRQRRGLETENKRWRSIGQKHGASAPEELDAHLDEIKARPASGDEAIKMQLEAERRDKARIAAEAEKTRNALQHYTVEREVNAAIGAARGNVRVLRPIVAQNVKLVEEAPGRFVPRVVDGAGNVRFNDATGEPLSVADLVAEMRREPDFAPNFEGSGNSGSGARGAGGSGAGGSKAHKVYTKDEWRNLVARAKPEDRTQLLKDLHAGRIVVRR